MLGSLALSGLPISKKNSLVALSWNAREALPAAARLFIVRKGTKQTVSNKLDCRSGPKQRHIIEMPLWWEDMKEWKMLCEEESPLDFFEM
jgi:hypothetical protein